LFNRGITLALVLMAGALRVSAQAPAPTPSPTPSPTPIPRRPIAESVEPAVERYLSEHGEPCTRAAAERIPCYPVVVEAHGPTYSVAESLRSWKPDLSAGAVGNPPVSPWGTPVGGVGFDPVCIGKSVAKSLRGKNDTYYLYRLWDQAGEHAVLRDRPLEPGQPSSAGSPRFELLGKIEGECEAIAAWRKANREAEERNRPSH
jgi:hypothetical protein